MFVVFKLTPWNVDTISHDKFAKTIINKDPVRQDDENLTEEQRAERYVRISFILLFDQTKKSD